MVVTCWICSSATFYSQVHTLEMWRQTLEQWYIISWFSVENYLIDFKCEASNRINAPTKHILKALKPGKKRKKQVKNSNYPFLGNILVPQPYWAWLLTTKEITVRCCPKLQKYSLFVETDALLSAAVRKAMYYTRWENFCNSIMLARKSEVRSSHTCGRQ